MTVYDLRNFIKLSHILAEPTVTSEISLIRKQLAEALESTLALKQEREKLEEKAAKYSQTVAELQATLDENAGITAALKEQLEHKYITYCPDRLSEYKNSLD